MAFTHRLASLSALCALVGAAGCYERPPSWAPARVVYEFEGVVKDGDVQLWGWSVNDDGDFAGAMATRQALSPITEDRNGERGTAAIDDSIELAVARDANGPYAIPAVVPGGCGVDGNGVPVNSFDMHVGVRNFHGARLTNTHIEMTAIQDNSGAGIDHSFCNSEPVAPNLLVAGAPVSNALGLIRYGNLVGDDNHALAPVGVTVDANGAVPEPLGNDATAHAMLWRFRSGAATPNFSFFGRVVADVCTVDCVPGTLAAPRGVDTNGIVNAVAEGQGVAWIGGSFSRVGHRTGAAFRTANTSGAAGLADAAFPAFDGGAVEVIIGDGADGYFVGGSFTHVGGVAAPRLVHLEPDVATGDLVVDSGFQPTTVTANGTVQDVELDGTRLWVGRIEAPFLSVLDATTGSVALTLSASPNNSIRQVTRAGDVMVVAGNFTNLGDRNRDKLAVYNPDTGVLGPLIVPVSGGGAREVETFAVVGSTLYIGGDFTSVGTGSANARNRLAAIDMAAGNGRGALLAWNPNANAQVFALVVDGGLVYVGGAFTTIGGQARDRLAALPREPTVASPVPTAFNPGASNTVNALALDTSARLVVGGAFTSLAGQIRDRVGIVDTTTGVAQPFDPSVTGPAGAAVRSILVTGAHYHFGGLFSFGGGAPAANLAAIDLATGAHLPSPAGVSGGVVNAVATIGDVVVVGGTFNAAGGQPRSNLAAFDGSGGVLPFSPVVSNTVRALAFDEATGLYVGGDFATIAGQPRSRLARFTAGLTLDPAFVPPAFSAAVRAVAVDADTGSVFAGGDFTAPATRLARLSTTGALVQNLNANGSVRALDVGHQRLYAAGDFGTLAGANRTRLGAVLLATNLVDPAFAPPGPDTRVDAIAVAGNTVVIGGTFATPRARIASFDNVSGALQPFAPLPVADGTGVNAVGIIGGAVFAGGELAAAGSLVNAGGLAVRRTSLVIAHAE